VASTAQEVRVTDCKSWRRQSAWTRALGAWSREYVVSGVYVSRRIHGQAKFTSLVSDRSCSSLGARRSHRNFPCSSLERASAVREQPAWRCVFHSKMFARGYLSMVLPSPCKLGLALSWSRTCRPEDYRRQYLFCIICPDLSRRISNLLCCNSFRALPCQRCNVYVVSILMYRTVVPFVGLSPRFWAASRNATVTGAHSRSPGFKKLSQIGNGKPRSGRHRQLVLWVPRQKFLLKPSRNSESSIQKC
jgi:hypothetical protein